MRRYITAILTAVSLLLCVAACVAWARSLLGETVLVGSIPGAFAVGSWQSSREFLNQVFGATSNSAVMNALSHSGDVERRVLGFVYASGTISGAPFWIVAVPYWLIVPVTAILPVRWWLIRRRQRARGVTGRCLGCGYDLRGSPERCPECGAAVASVESSLGESAIIGR